MLRSRKGIGKANQIADDVSDVMQTRSAAVSRVDRFLLIQERHR
jgi:hypothetical protein